MYYNNRTELALLGCVMVLSLLHVLNRLVGNIALIVTFSLWAYLTIRSWGAPVARALTFMLFGVFTTVAADVLVRDAQDITVITLLLRWSWIGIMLVPASMLHMVLALAQQLQIGRNYRWLVIGNYGVSLLVIILTVATDLIVRSPLRSGITPALTPQPAFSVVAFYVFSIVTVAWVILWRIRTAVLTPSLRRRISYMLASWYGPLLLSFPVLSLWADAELLPESIRLGLGIIAAPIAAIFMMITAYSATFVGTPQPDRLVKYDFLRWWLYGPFIGVSISLFLQVVPIVAKVTQLPADIWAVFGIMMMTVVMPILVTRVKPFLDNLIYANDHEDIDYLRMLPRTTFTQTDLRRFLENSLTVLCGASGSDSAFVAAPDDYGVYTVKMIVGGRRRIRQLFEHVPLEQLFLQAAASDDAHPFVIHDYGIMVLRDPDGQVVGLLGILYYDRILRPEVQQLVMTLTRQIEHALVMVSMQQRLLDTLRTMAPEMSSLQAMSSRIEQATPDALQSLEDDVAMMPEFASLVRDALTHYWGGPKLSESPLLGLRSVKRVRETNGLSPTKALQHVLRQAIDNIRPDAELMSSSSEAILYNILELRFLQGRRIRDTAIKLAMSESDLYRKQRIAVEEVARQISLMEEQQQSSEYGNAPSLTD